jgi:mannose-6-phosphate isomerase-like protein (cupin superfamily)
MAYRKPQRRPINPRTIKKHSTIVFEDQASSNIIGLRTKTDTGYVVAGSECPGFETFTEVFAPHSATSTMMHPKKSRSYRVVTGTGILVLGEDEVVKLLPGSTATVKPGQGFRIVTTGTAELEVCVAQSAKYAARLKIVDDSVVPAEASAATLREVTIEDAQASGIRPRLRGSKARDQMLTLSSSKKAGLQAKTGEPRNTPEFAVEVNLQPAAIVNGEVVG